MDDLGYYLGIHPLAAFSTVVATVLLYVCFAWLLRAWGQRMFASPSSFDLAVVTVLGAIVGRATMGQTPTLSAALLALGTLLLCERVAGRVRRTVRQKSHRHRAVAVVVAGHVDRSVLRRYAVDDVSLWSALRSAGVRDPQEVALAVLEPTGRFSVIRAGEDIHEAALTGVRHSHDVHSRLHRAGLAARPGRDAGPVADEPPLP